MWFNLGLLVPDVLCLTRPLNSFTFQEKCLRVSLEHNKETTHSKCLINCHSDAWTCFPVVAAMKWHTITSLSKWEWRSLTFVIDYNLHPFAFYFAEVVQIFTKTSHKPTGDVLKSITVSIQTLSFSCTFLSNPEWHVSHF